jgi:hypothetical protein
MSKVEYKSYTPRTREPLLRWREEANREHPERLDFRDEHLLWSVAAHFPLNREQRERLLGWSKDAWSRHVPKLIGWGFLTQETLSLGGKGGSFTILVPTEKGNDYLKRRLGQAPPAIHGSPLHYFAMLKVREWLEGKGYKVWANEKRDKLLPDLYAKRERDGEVLAVEIVASDNARRDMEKLGKLAPEVDRIVCVVIGGELKRAYEQAAERHLERAVQAKLGIHDYRSLMRG